MDLSKIDWAHYVLVALAIVGPVVIAIMKNKGYAQLALILDTVIQGVEKANDDKVKDHIQEAAKVANVAADLDKIVQKATGTGAEEN